MTAVFGNPEVFCSPLSCSTQGEGRIRAAVPLETRDVCGLDANTMLAKIRSVAVYGIDAIPVEIEVNCPGYGDFKTLTL
jgi:hypothetical protein